jgi:hypothetical protein
MTTIFNALRGLNNGQAIVAGWDNQATLKDITAYVGADGLNFLPVNDRSGYTPGVTRRLPTGGTFESGLPVVVLTSPWISYGQIDTLLNVIGGGQESSNVTLRHHISDSLSRTDTQNSNGVLNLNLDQLTQLERIENGYRGFQWEIVIVEVL